MDRENIKDLLNKFRAGTASAEEKAFLELWYSQYKDAEGLEYQLADRLGDANEIWAGLPVHETQIKRIKLWPRIAVAAAAVAVIVSGLWVFNYRSEILRDALDDKVVNDVAPGKNGATLTLANGKVIALSDAKSGIVVGQDLKYSDGSSVGRHPEFISGSRNSKSGGPDVGQDDIMRLKANTARGQTYQFTLPDGTKVWLNADSKLEFPSSFVNSKTRNVKLSGEGYFEVAKDKTHPFIVETDLQNIEVLGTHFNVNSYSDEPDTRTTLLEGSVQVTPKQVTSKQASAKARVMKPGQQAILDKRFDIQLKQVTDLEYFIAWRASGANDPGSMAFDNNTLEEVMRRISRWYNVSVEYRGNVKRDIRFSGMIKRNVPLSKVLRLLEATTQSVEFKIEGRRLIVMN